jgi:molybdopterin synthase catalytic subunit
MKDESRRDWVKLTLEPLDVAACVGFVSAPEAGGVDVFLGTTRGETNGAGQVLEALDYEAYQEMAVGQMLELARGVRERWPVVKCALHHRLGRVGVGEASVVIAGPPPHRGEAFEACGWLIDMLKKDVTVWKKEVWADGTGTWVHPEKKSDFDGAQSREDRSQKTEVQAGNSSD